MREKQICAVGTGIQQIITVHSTVYREWFIKVLLLEASPVILLFASRCARITRTHNETTHDTRSKPESLSATFEKIKIPCCLCDSRACGSAEQVLYFASLLLLGAAAGTVMKNGGGGDRSRFLSIDGEASAYFAACGLTKWSELIAQSAPTAGKKSPPDPQQDPLLLIELGQQGGGQKDAPDKGGDQASSAAAEEKASSGGGCAGGDGGGGGVGGGGAEVPSCSSRGRPLKKPKMGC